MIWPFKSKSPPSTGSSQVENPKLKAILVEHETQRTQQSHLRLLKELNTARYLAAAQDDAVNFSVNRITGLRTVDPESRFKILMAAAPDGQPLLALFTDYAELQAWAQEKATASWSFSAQEAWAFAQAVSAGVVVNPTSAAWVMGTEHITWLQQHPL